jgi:serine/threonine protein phosphatase PrpC
VTDEIPRWPLWTTEHDAATLPPGREHAELGLATLCSSCGHPVQPDGSFCEQCGAALNPAGPPAPPAEARECLECGGQVDADGYCQTCGAKAPTPREHFEQSPADWVGGVCDRGLAHHRNEDAMALWVADPGERSAVLVVCDGVSTSLDSDVAALAAAERARDLLAANRPAGLGTAESHAAAVAATLVEAAAAANAAVLEHTAPDSPNAASCTFSAAVLHEDHLHWANLGDSRTYWIGAHPQQLSVDDSMAQELISTGVPRAEAEAGRFAHTITRWLGRDAEDVVPGVGILPLTEDGWLLVCSDGLWNYASEPAALAAQVAAACEPGEEPVLVARRLVAWANSQGGRDNITVALARVRANLNGTTTPDPG